MGKPFNFSIVHNLSTLTYDEECKLIRDFLSNVEIFYTTPNEVSKCTLITFLLKWKIKGKGVIELGPGRPTSIVGLKTILNCTCGS